MKWVQWLIDNLWTVVIVAGVLMQMLQALRKKGADAPPEGEADQPKEYSFDDPDLADRTRKIREEIQRKIEARTRGQAAEPSVATRTEAPPVILETRVRSGTGQGGGRLEAQRHAEILEEQASMMAQLKEVERMKVATAKRELFESATADHQGERRTANRQEVLDGLKTPAELRRAFILREVLGPPVALRR